MFTSLARFTLALALASSVLGAAIPVTSVATTATATATSVVPATSVAPATSSAYHKGPVGALFKNNVHDRIQTSEAPVATAITEGRLNPSRRSGELWRGREHQEVARDGASSRRSGELWESFVHEVARDGASSRRSGELWRGLEHEEVSASPDA